MPKHATNYRNRCLRKSNTGHFVAHDALHLHIIDVIAILCGKLIIL